MSFAILCGLLACNAVWALSAIAGKFLLQSYPPFQLAQIRYGLALFTAYFLLAAFRVLKPQRLSPLRVIIEIRNFHWIASLGIITFFGSPILQYLGLIRSTATANSLVVAIEPLFAALLAWLFLREKLTRVEAAGFAIALAGFFLLSNLKPNNLGESASLFNVGNLFFLAVMPMEAFFTIVSRRLAGRVEPLSLFISALTLGFLMLSGYLWVIGEPLPSLLPLANWKNIFALIWVGPLGTTAAYIFWSEALISAPVAVVALTLLAQPIIGALSGYFFLGERLDLWQGLGAALILSALALQTFQSKEA
jgi:drug/metabolite transporter (DMT)-like permease